MCLPVPAKDNSCSLLMCKAGARKSPADLKEINDALGGGGQVADEVPRKKRSSKGKSQPGEDGEGEGEGQDVPPEVQRGVDPNNPNEEGCSGCVGCCKPGEPSGR
ncbi:unnamed protein product [Amoebophrya sp. A25]|nr:unnamed protein product [Amoebophrya sp. A25]|eukprot:GSA25T00014870001.1